MIQETAGAVADAVLLVAAGIGYIVCYLAAREEKSMRSIGYMLGGFIILTSMLLLLNDFVLAGRSCRMRKMMQRGSMMLPQRKMMMNGHHMLPSQTDMPVQQQDNK